MMTPEQIGRAYDRIAAWWDRGAQASDRGLSYLMRAIGLCVKKDKAVDIGCGSGRFVGHLQKAGFRVTGIDVSLSLLDLATARYPTASFMQADVCVWQPPNSYDLIVAWDSTFHVPLQAQREVHRRLCSALADGGVILFTAGGIRDERTGIMEGEPFYHASLGATDYMAILQETGCQCVLFERDQFPEDHCVILGVKRNQSGERAVANSPVIERPGQGSGSRPFSRIAFL